LPLIPLVAACTTSTISTAERQLSDDDELETWKDQGSELLALPPRLDLLSVATTGWVVGGVPSTTVVIVDGQLTVEGSARPDLKGARFTATAPGIPQVAMRIAAVRPHHNPWSGPELEDRYDYVIEYQDEDGVWRGLCSEEHSGAMVIPGSFGHSPRPDGAPPASNGDYDPEDGRFTFSCREGVASKCVDWGYPPWRHGDEMVAYFQACTRMARADYCGTGRSRTVEGTLISFGDLHRPRLTSHAAAPGFEPEAIWGPGRGTRRTPAAICMSRTRWSTIPLGERSLCIELMPDPRNSEVPLFCEDTPLDQWADAGALFVNKALPLDVGLHQWTDGADHYATTTQFPWLGRDTDAHGPPGYPEFVSIEGPVYKLTLPRRLLSDLVPLFRYTGLRGNPRASLTTTDPDLGREFGDRVLEAYVFPPSLDPPVPTARPLYIFHDDSGNRATGTEAPAGYTERTQIGWLPH